MKLRRLVNFRVGFVLTLMIAGLIIGIFVLKPRVDRYYAESQTGASIPEDAKHVKLFYLSWQGQTLRLRPDLPPASAYEFLLELGLTKYKLQEGFDPYTPGETKENWWRPHEAKAFEGARWVNLPCAGRVYEILIDKTRHDSYTLYLTVGEG